MKKWDALIIGGGISSLTSAILLLQAGKSVCVLEKNNDIGGYMQCFKRFGHLYDTGAHYLGALSAGDSFYTLLNYLEIYDPKIFFPLDSKSFDVFNFPSFQFSFGCGYEQNIQNLIQMYPKEEKGIRKYFQLVKESTDNFPTYSFNKQYDSSKMQRFLSISLKSVVEELTNNSQLKLIFYTYCVLHGVKPADVSFGFHALVVDSLIRSAYGFRYGGEKLIELFKKKIIEKGGDIFTGTEVKEIIIDGNNVEKVIAKNSKEYKEYYADWVISGIHPKITFDLIDKDQLRPAFISRLNNISETAGIFAIYGTYQQTLPFDPLKNYFYFSNEDPNKFMDIGDPLDDPTVMFLFAPNRGEFSDTSSNMNFPFTVHAPGPFEWFSKWKANDIIERRKKNDYQKLKKEIGENILSFIQDKHPAFKRSQVKQYETSTPLTNLTYNGTCDGSAHGIYHSIKNTGIRSLGPRTHFRNLLLTGQNTLFPGLVASAISGLRTAGQIIGIKKILKDLQRPTK